MDTSRSRGAGRNRFHTISAAGIFAVFLLAPPAHADGDSRPATEQEKKFHSLVMGVLQKAIPPGPKGWREERDAIEPLERVSPGSEKYPLRASHRVKWTD